MSRVAIIIDGWTSSPPNIILKRYPRLASVCLFIVLPLLFLIGLCFLCGFFLAVLEGPGELKTNDDALKAWFETNVNKTFGEIDASVPFDGMSSVVSLHWSRCNNDKVDALSSNQKTFAETWLRNGRSLYEAYKEEGMPRDKASVLSAEQASGSDDCYVNIAGGALFWFTVMTTIGYGNTVPETMGGRAMIYSLGFVSILLFTAVSARAGYVSLLFADEWFERRPGLRFLKEGRRACCFWLCAYYGWNLIAAGIYLASSEGHWNLKEAFWFSFISTTTVGFGDVHVPHLAFFAPQMFYLASLLLIGFVLLANFLLKFADCCYEALPKSESVLGVAESTRRLSEQQADPTPAENSSDGTGAVPPQQQPLLTNITVLV